VALKETAVASCQWPVHSDGENDNETAGNR